MCLSIKIDVWWIVIVRTPSNNFVKFGVKIKFNFESKIHHNKIFRWQMVSNL